MDAKYDELRENEGSLQGWVGMPFSSHMSFYTC
jgi:hypothetical protein